MEYLGNVANRKVDNKRRIVLPPIWVNDNAADGFFFIQKEDNIEVYPYMIWKRRLMEIEDVSEKLAWSKKSSKVMYLTVPNRLLLPSACTWQKVDLIGMGEYIIINESAVWSRFFLFSTIRK